MGDDDKDGPVEGGGASRLERLARPLLELVQRITGVETAFLTEVDWVEQIQHIVVACNSGDMEVPGGIAVPWPDAMCRHVFLSGKPQSSDVGRDFPGSVGAEVLGMQSVFSVPVLDGDTIIGTICGASRRVVRLGSDQLEMMLLIGAALAQAVKGDLEWRMHEADTEAVLSVTRDRVAQLTTRAHAMEELALNDGLTGLSNRRGFDARWEQELSSSGRHEHPLALLLLDIDSFKLVNDTYGHDGGDRALRALADQLRSVSRAEDVAGRLGGDEFALAVPHTDANGAAALATRIRVAFAEATDVIGVPCTVTIGVSSTEHQHRSVLMATADKALYHGKRLGRDRIELASTHDV